jgi:hypothetical protein
MVSREIDVFEQNYFEPSSSQKYFHFFKELSQEVYLMDLDSLTRTAEKTSSFKVINLDIRFNIPRNHRSIITPYGDIYLSGGISENLNNLKGLYKLNIITRSLEPLAAMLEGRSNHALTFCNNYIFAAGGDTDVERPTTTCECFDIIKGEWKEIAPLRRRSEGLSLVAVDNKYIFKFGGTTIPRASIERYEV